MTIIQDVEKFQKEFEDYVKKFEFVRELARRFKTNPGAVMEMFFGIGIEALKHTEAILQKDFNSKLKEIFPEDFEAITEDVKKACFLFVKTQQDKKK